MTPRRPRAAGAACLRYERRRTVTAAQAHGVMDARLLRPGSVARGWACEGCQLPCCGGLDVRIARWASERMGSYLRMRPNMPASSPDRAAAARMRRGAPARPAPDPRRPPNCRPRSGRRCGGRRRWRRCAACPATTHTRTAARPTPTGPRSIWACCCASSAAACTGAWACTCPRRALRALPRSGCPPVRAPRLAPELVAGACSRSNPLLMPGCSA